MKWKPFLVHWKFDLITKRNADATLFLFDQRREEKNKTKFNFLLHFSWEVSSSVQTLADTHYYCYSADINGHAAVQWFPPPFLLLSFFFFFCLFHLHRSVCFVLCVWLCSWLCGVLLCYVYLLFLFAVVANVDVVVVVVFLW